MAYLTFEQRFKIPNYLKADEVTTGRVDFDEKTCINCGICAAICPARSIIVPEKGNNKKGAAPYLEELAPDVTLCVACGCCIAACPEDSITMTRGFRAGFFFLRLIQSTDLEFPKKY